MNYRGFFGVLLAWLPFVCQAAPQLDKAVITKEVKSYLYQVYEQQFPELDLAEDVKFRPSNLDKRLALSACDTPLKKVINSPQPMAANITVKLSCESGSQWTIYVPVKVEIYTDVLVANRNLAKGTLLSEADMNYARMNIAQAGMGYFEDLSQVVGMELKRGVRAGNTIQSSVLTAPTVVKRGDTVQLQATIAGVAVVTSGEALSHGQLGQQIRVRNSRSQRIVDAVVTAPGKVSVSL